MHQTELLEVLVQEQDLALLVDRRSRRLEEMNGATVVRSWPLQRDNNRMGAHAYLLRMDRQANLRMLLTEDGCRYVRRMDRFFVPEVSDPLVTAALFDCISDLYEKFTSTEVNIETAYVLLSTITEQCRADPDVLDFGCGTGLAMLAVPRLTVRPRVFGTDVSRCMLELARARGELTMSVEDWRTDKQTYTGAIASFVLHYGVADHDLVLIAERLDPGGKFAANFFKGDCLQLSSLVQLLQLNGMRLEREFEISARGLHGNTALVFVKTHRS